MTKWLACAVFTLLASHILYAQDTSELVPPKIFFDTTFGKIDPTVKPLVIAAPKDSSLAMLKDSNSSLLAGDTISPLSKDSGLAQSKDTSSTRQSGDMKLVVDKSEPAQVGSNQDFDNRWFISPLFKFQYQDYGMLEKNHFGYQSNANNLSMLDRGNIGGMLSAYKNITSRFSASADIGLAYGHVTSTDVLVGTTTPKTYNVLDLSAYYHLLPGRYKLQPYITVGIHDLINDQSYLTVPAGVGVKFHSRRLMILGQAAYGYGVTKNNASTVMYTLGAYVPVNFRKKKPMDDEDVANANALNKKDSLNKNSKDTSALKNTIVNNVNITINMDSAIAARYGKNGTSGRSGANGKNGKNGNDGYDDEFVQDDGDGMNTNTHTNGKKGLKAFNYDDFSVDDFEVDSIDGKEVVKFVIYFEFNQYDLNSSAFARLDKVISRLRADKSLLVSIKGYTDNVGTNEYNLMLSRKRAEIVYKYINSRGVATERLTSRFYGKENPV
ncbi:MAG: OmpA family protein, partial [Bacteroidetes bacterium]|nr:OmpA family protein [Bacteroidota bacterium]